MSESTCLHIQGRESDPIRVVELPWISVRIGRAPYCEVRLSEHELAEEACRLQKRGRSWHLVSVGKESPIAIEGRPVDGSCLLPFDVPFCVGHYCLTLRRDRAAEPNWEMYQEPCPPRTDPSAHLRDSRFGMHPDRSTPDVDPRNPTAPAEVVGTTADRADPTEERPAAASVKDRWEARWRAAGAELGTRSQRSVGTEQRGRPDYGTSFSAMPLKDRTVRAPRPAVPSAADPTHRQITATPGTAKTHPDWAASIAQTPERLVPRQFSWSDWIDRDKRIGAPQAETIEPAASAEGSPDLGANSLVEDTSTEFDCVPRRDVSGDEIDPVVDVELTQEPEDHSQRHQAVQPSEPREVQTAASIFERMGTEPPWEERRKPPVIAHTDLATIFETIDAISPLTDAPDMDRTPAPPAADSVPRTPIAAAPAVAGRDPAVADRSFKASFEVDTSNVPGKGIDPSGDLSGLAFFDRLDQKRPDPRKAKIAGSGVKVEEPFQPREPGRPQSSGRRAHQPTDAKRRMPSRAPGGAEPGVSGAVSPAPMQPDDSVEWPSAQEILATCQARAIPRTPVASGRAGVTHAAPTMACEPSHWTVPLWLVWPPMAGLVVAVGVLGCLLSWSWASDSYSAGVMTERLMANDAVPRRDPLPDSIAPPAGSWTKTTAQHLAHWAVYLDRVGRGKEDSEPDVRGLLTTALQVSPVNATARLAQAQLEPPGDETKASLRGLGLSRDPLSLAWTARRLLDNGKKEAALNVYRRAIEIASHSEFSQITPPRFNNDPAVPRFLLPGEERIRDVVRELVTITDWTVDDWKRVVPQHTSAPLALARLFHEQGRKDVVDALLDRMLDDSQPVSTDRSNEALSRACRAEVLALFSRWREADQAYREAIELMDNVTIKRSWWFNLADIASRLPDDGKRQSALQATLTVANSDDISRRATEILRTASTRTRLRSNGTKAN